MKKIISLIAVLAFLFFLMACSSKLPDSTLSTSEEVKASSDAGQTKPDDSQKPSSSPEVNSDPVDEPTGMGSKSLIVYFSHSGNTESVAKEIQSQTGADIFKIVPATPYTTDYDTLLDVAQNEKRSNARPAISGTIENLDDYDIIYLGYPNWWADMPMVVYTFLDTYDLSGKTIAPFVTSGGSGFSNTINTIKSMEPNAAVADGLAIRDSVAGNPASAVSEWLETLK